MLDRYVDGDVLYETCMAGAKEELDEVESRESDRVIATETRAGVMLDVGDVKYMSTVVYELLVECG